MAKSSVVDPYWCNCGSGFGSNILGQCGSTFGSTELMTKNWKFYCWKKFKSAYNFLLGLHEGLPSQEKPLALKTKHPALQNNTFLHFFLYLRVILPTWIRGSGSSRPKTMRIHADPDPQHWQKHIIFLKQCWVVTDHFSGVSRFLWVSYLIFYAPQGKWLCVMNCSLGHQGQQQSLACWQQLSLWRELDVHSAPIWYFIWHISGA